MNKYRFLKTLILTGAFLMAFNISTAQDKIHKTDSTIVEAKVIEITSADVKYKKYNNLNGPIYSVSKANIAFIRYENGDKDVFEPGSYQAASTYVPVMMDSVQFIENMWGVKFENTAENDGGVKIVKIENNIVFKPQSSLKKANIYNVNKGIDVRVKNTSQLARVLFETYNQGITKINLSPAKGSQLSYLTSDTKGIDISALAKFSGMDTAKKIGKDASSAAGESVAKIYHPGTMWATQGFCAGLLLGVFGPPLITGAALFNPVTPAAPSNVDATEWTKAYQKRIKKKRVISGIIGSVAGAVLVIATFSSVQ